MAGEEDKTVVESGKGQAEAAPAEKAKKGSGPLVFIGIGVGAIVIGIALALFVIKPMMSDSGGDAGHEETSQTEKAEKSQSKKPSGKEHGAGEVLVHEINNIVVNPAGTGGSRFLSASFAFELESPTLRTEFEKRELIVRDALITILSSKTVAQLTDPKQKEIVRYQIKKRVAQLMHTEDLAAVYFTDFVLQ